MFGWVTSKILGYFAGGLGVALAVSLTWGGIGWNRAGHWKHTAQDCQAKSQTAAEANARAKAQQELAYKQKAEQADERYTQGLAAADDRVTEYIRTHRVRTVYRSTPESSGGSSAQGADGSGEAAELDAVAVSEDDIRICTENTRRLMEAKGWAATLNVQIPSSAQ